MNYTWYVLYHTMHGYIPWYISVFCIRALSRGVLILLKQYCVLVMLSTSSLRRRPSSPSLKSYSNSCSALSKESLHASKNKKRNYVLNNFFMKLKEQGALQLLVYQTDGKLVLKRVRRETWERGSPTFVANLRAKLRAKRRTNHATQGWPLRQALVKSPNQQLPAGNSRAIEKSVRD